MRVLFGDNWSLAFFGAATPVAALFDFHRKIKKERETKMKRILILLIILTTCLACFTSCKLINRLFPCNHKETAIDRAIAPTCTESGLSEGSHCVKCGEAVVAQQTLPALGHTEVIDETVPATCTEDGLSAGVYCSVCNATVITQKVIPAAHTYGDWQTVTEPDCFFEGEQTRACSVCDEIDTQKLAKIEHSFVQNEKTKLFACEHCDARIYAGHLYAAFDVEVNWVDAYKICDSIGGHLVTITSEGEQKLITEIANECAYEPNDYYSYYGYYYWTGGLKDTYGWEWITGEDFQYTHWSSSDPENLSMEWQIVISVGCDDKRGPANIIGDWEDTGHYRNHGFICEWNLDIKECEHYFIEWEITTSVSCYGDGEQWRICTHCGLEETEVLPNIEHNFVFNEASGVTSCEHCSAAMYNGRIYKIFNVQLSWFDAYTYCDNLSGHLVTITSQDEQTFIETYMNSQSFGTEAWIGSYSDGAKWQWITDEAFDYTNWDGRQPDCDWGYEFFGTINHGFGRWNDRNPLVQTYFICEWEAE